MLAGRTVCLPADPEELTIVAITHVELVADDRKPHRVRTIEQLPVFYCVKADVDGDVRRPAAIPTGAMAGLPDGNRHSVNQLSAIGYQRSAIGCQLSARQRFG